MYGSRTNAEGPDADGLTYRQATPDLLIGSSIVLMSDATTDAGLERTELLMK